MKRSILKKCLVTLGLYLFFTVVIPFPIAGRVAYASSVEVEQSDIKLNVKAKSLVKDSTYALILYNIKDSYKVTYKSNESSIATVDESGLITGVDFGSATISATVKDGSKTIATLQCDVTVGPAAIKIELAKHEVTLTVGSKTTLTAFLKSIYTVETAKYFSEDPKIASVSTGGRITAKAAGVTTIRAYIDNGNYDTCKVTIVEDDSSKNKTDTGANTSE